MAGQPGQCGLRCQLPLRKPTCTGLCTMDASHVGPCRCLSHENDEYTDPFEAMRKTKFSEVCDAAAMRGIQPSQATTLWSAGHRNLEAIKTMPSLELQRLVGQQQVNDPINPSVSAVVAVRARPDHPIIQYTARGSRSLMFEKLTTKEGREEALREVDSLRETENSKRTSASLWQTWCEVMKTHRYR